MKRAFFSIADNNNLPYFEMLKNSLRKFDAKTDFFLFGENDIRSTRDTEIFYRATPYFAKKLFEQGYTEVCKLDADQIILGNLDHIWEGDFDLAVVNNSNPKEFQTYPVSVWDINPLAYVNAGFVVMKSQEFIDHWLNLCYSEHFKSYQMREQDLLNILVFYGNYTVKFLDNSDKWHGLISKKYTPSAKLDVAKRVILTKNAEWPQDQDKQIVAFHWGGGANAPDKMKYRLVFSEEVSDYIETLIK